MVDNPVAREMVGYLLVRGGTHIVAYAKAFEELTGVNVGKCFRSPISATSISRGPKARRTRPASHEPERLQRDGSIWTGPHPEDGSPLEVIDGPPEGFTPPNLDAEPQLTAPVGPDMDPGMLEDVAKKLFGSSTKSTPTRRKS